MIKTLKILRPKKFTEKYSDETNRKLDIIYSNIFTYNVPHFFGCIYKSQFFPLKCSFISENPAKQI